MTSIFANYFLFHYFSTKRQEDDICNYQVLTISGFRELIKKEMFRV